MLVLTPSVALAPVPAALGSVLKVAEQAASRLTAAEIRQAIRMGLSGSASDSSLTRIAPGPSETDHRIPPFSSSSACPTALP
jgi:hypothetical protein